MKTTVLKVESILTVSVLSVISFGQIHAQLYSSGNNAISGNKVGIGTGTPGAMLEIRNEVIPAPNCVNCLSLQEQDVPIIRLSSQVVPNPPGSGLTMNYKWELEARNGLTLAKVISPSNSPILFSLDESITSILTPSARVTPNFEFGKINASGGSRYMIGFNMKYDGVNYTVINTAEQGSLIQSVDGTLKFYTGINSSVNPAVRLNISNNGNVGIGTTNPSAKLEVKNGDMKVTGGDLAVNNGDFAVNNGRFVIANSSGVNHFEVNSQGYVVAREILVDINEAIPDYVFDESYELMTLEDLRKYLAEENHLPNIPSASDYEAAGGIQLGDLTTRLLEKQEELVLYILQLEERVAQLEMQPVQ